MSNIRKHAVTITRYAPQRTVILLANREGHEEICIFTEFVFHHIVLASSFNWNFAIGKSEWMIK